jgi:hypothetical protein
MNEHIRKGNDAVLAGDIDTAIKEFYEALDSTDITVKRIAQNPPLAIVSRRCNWKHEQYAISPGHLCLRAEYLAQPPSQFSRLARGGISRIPSVPKLQPPTAEPAED